MQPLKRGCLQLLLKLAVGLVSLGTFYLVHQWTDRTLGYRWLEYTEDDGGPERVCNCSGILQGEQEALQQVKLLTITRDFSKNIQIPDEYYINETQDCRKFKLKRKYLPFPLSKEEEDFPLAYSMVIHHKVQNFERLLRAIYAPQNIYCVHVDKKAKPSVTAAIQVQNFERLLRAIYAPQNIYCVHVDKKAKPSVTAAIQAITSCFPNVFLVSQAVEVVYAGWPRVQADLNCMADLYSASTKWKYFINLCGQDFPLKTNLEMVRMLRSLRGSNSLESESVPADKKWRLSYVHEIINGDVKTTKKLKNPAPFNLPLKSGSAYIVVSRGFVRSVLEDTRIEMLIKWFKDTYSPDEFLWATIQRIPGVPGSKWPNRKYDQTDINAIARLVKWENHEGSQDSESAVYPKCQGNHVRAVCVYGAGDLQWLLEHLHLFANKFDTETDPVAIYCLEKYLRHKALAEAVGESV